MDFEKYKITGDKTDADSLNLNALNLSALETDVDGGESQAELKDRREELWDEIADLQEALFAESKQSLLVVLQAMDAAGKDSSIEKLTSRLNAQGCKVHSFKKPSKIELAHDFLWRVHQVAPKAGDITLFNRSHYEDVLIVKVHGWASEAKINQRYEHINNFESLLRDRGTRVVKFMLNISPEYQLERFRNRLDRGEKNWKFNPGDLDERRHWDKYMQAFEVAMQKCSTEHAPWYVVPAENRRFRDVMLATVVRDTLKEMAPQYPDPDFDSSTYNVETLDDLVS